MYRVKERRFKRVTLTLAALILALSLSITCARSLSLTLDATELARGLLVSTGMGIIDPVERAGDDGLAKREDGEA